MRYEVYVAALLHDIGKFGQRSDAAYWESNCQLSEQSQKVKEHICPTYGGKHTYQHVIWTYDFFEKTLNTWQQLGLLPETFTSGQLLQEDNLVSLASYHHKPQTRLQAMIQLADWWASGIDRENSGAEESKLEPHHGTFRDVPLYSVWDRIKKKGSTDSTQWVESNTGKWVFPIAPLRLSDTDSASKELFPLQNTGSSLAESYKTHWKGFIEEFARLKATGKSVKAFTETLHFLLKRYLWCLSSSSHTKDIPSVSLFEHLKVTGAIAQSMYDYTTEYPESFIWEQSGKPRFAEGHLPLMLICGDISGIQSYIYNIASRKAAMALKGRSFFLQLLTDTLISRILEDCQLTSSHVVYASGGKFYVLAPHTTLVKEKLAKLEQEVLASLRRENHGELYVCMDWVPFTYDQLGSKSSPSSVLFEKETGGSVISGSISDLWQAAMQKAARKKQQKFMHLLHADFAHFFGENGQGIGDGGVIVGQNRVLCAITGEFTNAEKENLLDPRAEQKTFVIPEIRKQIDLGKDLRDADIIVSVNSQPNEEIKGKYMCIEPLGLGITHYLFDEAELRKQDAAKLASTGFAKIRYLNRPQFTEEKTVRGNQAAYAFSFYGGNRQALRQDAQGNYLDEDGAICREQHAAYKTFEDLAGRSDQGDEKGMSRLGILRMDVDGLGGIFSNRIPQPSLAAFATLSFQLDLFFSGYLNLLREQAHFQPHVNILYSGGDDIFAIGRWDKLLEFAVEIRAAFRKFVCEREDISLSAGMILVGPKFPISKAADLAGEAEEAAKNFIPLPHAGITFSNTEKNAISFLGETVCWEHELQTVRELKNTFIELRNARKISASFLRKLLSFYLTKKEAERKNKNDFSYRWNTAYNIGREKKNLREKDQEIIQLLDTLQKNLFTSDRYYDLCALAIRWAELELRTNPSSVN